MVCPSPWSSKTVSINSAMTLPELDTFCVAMRTSASYSPSSSKLNLAFNASSSFSALYKLMFVSLPYFNTGVLFEPCAFYHHTCHHFFPELCFVYVNNNLCLFVVLCEDVFIINIH